jgi:hypothetical protein
MKQHSARERESVNPCLGARDPAGHSPRSCPRPPALVLALKEDIRYNLYCRLRHPAGSLENGSLVVLQNFFFMYCNLTTYMSATLKKSFTATFPTLKFSANLFYPETDELKTRS